MGGFSALKLASVGQSVEDLCTSALVSSEVLGRIEGKMERTQSFAAQAFLDPTWAQVTSKGRREAEKRLKAKLATLRPTVHSPEEHHP